MHDAAAASAVPSFSPSSLSDNLAFTLEQAAALSGVGRSALYAAARAGRLVARKCGRRTVVLRGDLQTFLERLPVSDLKRGA